MKVAKKTPEYTIYEKRSRRYAVKGADNKWINAEEKVKILLAEKLIEVKLPKPSEKEASEKEAPAEEAATEAEAAPEASADASEEPAKES